MAKSKRNRIHLSLWAGSILAVITVGIVFFPREYPELGFWETLYATLRLFVFERDIESFPTSWPLVMIYFVAPLIALSTLGVVVTYLFHLTPSLKSRRMKNHVVICGMGRTGKILASSIKAKRVPLVGVDLGPADDFQEWAAENKVDILFGDFNSRALLEKARASGARSLLFTSGSDLANLEGAIGAYDWLRSNDGPVKLIWTHIANERLADTARKAVRTEGKVGIRFFDTYRIAAKKMISAGFHRALRREISRVTILGFGKFGRDLMEVLVRDLGPGEKFSIQVVDVRDRRKEVRLLATDLGVADRVSFARGAIQDLDLVDGKDKAFFICTDDDLGNLAAAMQLAGRVNCTYIFVRMTHWPLSAIADHLGEERGVEFVNINELVAEGVKDLPGIFEPARDSHLKRIK